MNPSQEFVYVRSYSRWLPEQNRRETYEESVDRFINFFADSIPEIKQPHKSQVKDAMMEMSVMGSMRAFWAAGPAAQNNNITLYNCSYLPIKDIFSFSEILYILMCGTGVGFSVERRFVEQLPQIATTQTSRLSPTKIIVEDSKEGWAKAINKVLTLLWDGMPFVVDYSLVRPAGSRLLTMGGRASGSGPLKDLVDFATSLFCKRQGKKLQPIDCLDIACKIAEIVVVGGVRRSSLICLFDADNKSVAEAKTGEFWREYPHRAMSNNSAVFETKPTNEEFILNWLTLIKSGSGEPGIFNREAALKQMVFSGRRSADLDVGTNPCSEISLKPYQFCNLSEVVVRPKDTLDILKEKVKTAAMLGSWQATMVKFPYIRPEWTKNCSEERLLGVSLTGIFDHHVLSDVYKAHVGDECKKWLAELKHTALRETARWAKKLDIPMSVAVTCVKPSGTVSQMVNSASGIHPRFAKYYIRRYRISAADPLFKMLQEMGVPCNPEVGQEPNTASTWVLDFPIKAPEKAKTRHDLTAIQQLEHWKVVKEFWCEHNPSITVYVNEDEWMDVGAWVYKNWDYLVGVSFLPKTSHVYRLAPYEEIDEATYKVLQSKFPKIDYNKLSEYELFDNTTGSQQLACTGGACDI